MRALRYFGKGDFRLDEIPEPERTPHNIVARVKWCAICGTDVKLFSQDNPRFKIGQTLGHEFCAEVVHVGDQVSGWNVGDRLTMATSISCMECQVCRSGRTNLCDRLAPVSGEYPGAFAQYIEIPAAGLRGGNAIKVPANVPDQWAALAEPVSCAINAQQEVRVGPGDQVLIIGGGPLGCLHVEVARAFGATRVFVAQRSRPRSDLCRKMRVDEVITGGVDLARRVAELTNGRGADVVIVAAADPSVQGNSPALAAKGGRVSLFASLPKEAPDIVVNSRTVHYRQVSIHGATDSTPAQVQLAVDLMASRQINCESVITHSFSLDRFHAGLDVMLGKQGLKVLIGPHQSPFEGGGPKGRGM